MNIENVLLTQRMMAEIARENPSTINRFIAHNKIDCQPNSGQKNFKYSIENTQKILMNFVSGKKKITPQVWSFYNFKGGTGKTSLCFQLSSLLALCGYRVLVIDADPQGNLSTSLGFDTSESYFTLYDVVTKSVSPFEAIKEVFPGYSCIPSNISCSRFDMELSMLGRREEQFRIKLSSLKSKFDFIIFDTNPNISFIIRNISVFSDLMCIPCETQPYSINALGVLFEDMFSFFEMMGTTPPDLTVIPNKYEDRYGTSAEAMSVLRRNYTQYLIPDFAVRKAEDFNISAKEGLPLPAIAKKNSIAIQDIIELFYYLLDQKIK